MTNEYSALITTKGCSDEQNTAVFQGKALYFCGVGGGWLFFNPVDGCLLWQCNPLCFWLCWGLTSQSTIFQSYRDGAIASWVINQYFRGVKCLAQGHNTAAVGLEPRTSRSGVRHSTTELPRSPNPLCGCPSQKCSSVGILRSNGILWVVWV